MIQLIKLILYSREYLKYLPSLCLPSNICSAETLLCFVLGTTALLELCKHSFSDARQVKAVICVVKSSQHEAY